MKAVVLLSSGLDSTTNLYWAQKKYEVVLALTFDYGQKAATQEIRKSKELCKQLKVPHQVVDLKWIKAFGGSSLLDEQKEIPTGVDIGIDDHQKSVASAQKVWVPNRNGIFLNIAAGFAESLNAQKVIPGFNKEEAATFPDNSADFMKALDQSFAFSTANKVTLECMTVELDKTAIVKKAIELGVDWKLVWPCYFAYDQWCGKCESCLRFERALSVNQLDLSDYFYKGSM